MLPIRPPLDVFGALGGRKWHANRNLDATFILDFCTHQTPTFKRSPLLSQTDERHASYNSLKSCCPTDALTGCWVSRRSRQSVECLCNVFRVSFNRRRSHHRRRIRLSLERRQKRSHLVLGLVNGCCRHFRFRFDPEVLGDDVGRHVIVETTENVWCMSCVGGGTRRRGGDVDRMRLSDTNNTC